MGNEVHILMHKASSLNESGTDQEEHYGDFVGTACLQAWSGHIITEWNGSRLCTALTKSLTSTEVESTSISCDPKANKNNTEYTLYMKVLVSCAYIIHRFK